ncbi:GTP-binding protein [bacterium]|nr:GTP-binding protein [candidate division CSSED10-310 bacterium]
MIQKKICMLGAFAVGKTSLVERFVKSIFSDKYLTTVGVKIDKKTVELDGESVNLILWDIQGDDELQTFRTSYLKGASGFILVADQTRAGTLDTAERLCRTAVGTSRQTPFLLAVNKSDLTIDPDFDPVRLTRLESDGWHIVHTSAKTGWGVDEAFSWLARKLTGK